VELVRRRRTEHWTVVWISPSWRDARFEEVLEKVLKEIDAGGELHVDVAVIFEDKPRNVGNDECILKMTTAILHTREDGTDLFR
jgi:hypothetical protein